MPTNTQKDPFGLAEYADEDLPREWNRLETLKATKYNDAKADAIMTECERRRIVAWNKDGNITQRDHQ